MGREWNGQLTRSFWVMPLSIFESHAGDWPFSVAKWVSKPALLNAVYGTAVSAWWEWYKLVDSVEEEKINHLLDRGRNQT